MLNRWATLADVDDENGTETGPWCEMITLNQVVAWNIAFYRRAAGFTQKKLGDRIGWTNTAVSEAERSWDGRRVREFDAHTLSLFCLGLGVPLIALFLPPEEREGVSYTFTNPAGSAEYDMADLTGLIVMPDSPDNSPAMEAYRDRLRGAVTRYLDPEWAEEVAGWLRDIDDDGRFEDRAARLRARQAELLAAAGEIGDLASAIEKRGMRR